MITHPCPNFNGGFTLTTVLRMDVIASRVHYVIYM